jgi:hypothetical protein
MEQFMAILTKPTTNQLKFKIMKNLFTAVALVAVALISVANMNTKEVKKAKSDRLTASVQATKGGALVAGGYTKKVDPVMP